MLSVIHMHPQHIVSDPLYARMSCFTKSASSCFLLAALSHKTTQQRYHIKSLSDPPFWTTSYASKEKWKNTQPHKQSKVTNWTAITTGSKKKQTNQPTKTLGQIWSGKKIPTTVSRLWTKGLPSTSFPLNKAPSWKSLETENYWTAAEKKPQLFLRRWDVHAQVWNKHLSPKARIVHGWSIRETSGNS